MTVVIRVIYKSQLKCRFGINQYHMRQLVCIVKKLYFVHAPEHLVIILILFSGNIIRADDVAEHVLSSTENSEDVSSCNINTEV